MWNLKCMIIPVIISHWNSNKRFKEKFGSYSRKMFNVFITKDGYTWNITHDTENCIL
jgi:CRISPR/Cas system CMR-associated protein Cmr5 small subunit